MVIKWKKWIETKKSKKIIGFFAFFLCINLLIASVMGFAKASMEHSVGFGVSSKNKQAEDTQDYQYCERFERYISGMLMSFLDMASGEYNGYDYMNGYYDYYGYYGYENTATEDVSSDTIYEGSDTSAMESEYPDAEAQSEEAAELEARDIAMSDYDYSGNASSGTEPVSGEERRQYARNFHEYLKNDKNLLYEISYAGKVLYTNMENVSGNTKWTMQNLPEGYNFYLHFDGQQVTASKDGNEIDIYGDGIYRENESWYVPGYKNLTGKDNWHKAEVTMIAAEEPVPYINSYDYYGNIYDIGHGRLYSIYQDLQEGLALKHHAMVLLGFSVLLFIIYVIFRKEKKEADQWIAEKTKHLWFECKLLLLIAFPLFLIWKVFRENWDFLQEYTYLLTQEDSGISYYEYLQELGGLAGNLLYSPIIAAVLFWILYFFFNDAVKNHPIYKHGIIAKLIFAYRGREANLPIAKKMIYRLLPVFILSILAAIFIILWTIECLALSNGDHSGGTSYVPSWILFLSVILLLLSLLAAEYLVQKKNKRIGLELEQLAKAISDIQSGNFSKENLSPDSNSELYFMAKDLEKICDGIEYAVEERTKSERMKVELVANVSHDLKTPLTSIISYIQLLKQEEGLPDYIRDYVRILDEKAERLKNMVQDVFSVSKATSGQLEVEKKELDFGKLLEQTLADMQEQIENSAVTLKTEFPVRQITVLADGSRMYRVFQNLIGNALKYSLEGSRIYLTLQTEGSNATACIRNTSKKELCNDIDFTERFTRGDKSRTDGGSGLGLSIAKSFTEACGGSFRVEVIADLFVVTVTLPLAE